ncbi:Hypothetical predicted protein [Mytilus galloprovincialis]|uniref:Uncharacterized protein n=1 Tax=Mytilus galloprovincialis TaxID=29158 RepID=A0A8B6D7I3_MYTGA|nr:Hypothetical predicted protein [Mytilus galloprovincialis]
MLPYKLSDIEARQTNKQRYSSDRKSDRQSDRQRHNVTIQTVRYRGSAHRKTKILIRQKVRKTVRQTETQCSADRKTKILIRQKVRKTVRQTETQCYHTKLSDIEALQTTKQKILIRQKVRQTDRDTMLPYKLSDIEALQTTKQRYSSDRKSDRQSDIQRHNVTIQTVRYRGSADRLTVRYRGSADKQTKILIRQKVRQTVRHTETQCYHTNCQI